MDNDEGIGPSSAPTKRCPYCAELIHESAMKCKHCGEYLSEDARRASKRPSMEFLGKIMIVVVVVVALFLTYYFTGLGATLDAQCSTNGFGTGECLFINEGWSPGRACVRILLEDSTSGAHKAEVPRVCSSRVWPGGSVTRPFILDPSPVSVCKSDDPFKMWTEICDIVVMEQ